MARVRKIINKCPWNIPRVFYISGGLSFDKGRNITIDKMKYSANRYAGNLLNKAYDFGMNLLFCIANKAK